MRLPNRSDGVTVAHAVAALCAVFAMLAAADARVALAAALAGACSILGLLWSRVVGQMAAAARPAEPAEAGLPAMPDGDSEKLRREIRQMTTMLDRELVQAMGDVVDRTDRMSRRAAELTTLAADMRHSSSATAEAVELATVGVATTAQAADELARSLELVRDDIRRTGAMCHQAVERARNADHTVQSLSDSTAHVGQVVAVIGAIARQTNMLALNATIEAARAGEMGKGFAVVATEVKTLATSTARSTAEIADRVDAIHAAITGAVDSIGAIVQVVDGLDAIATAMEQSMAAHLSLTERIAARTSDAAASMRTAEGNLTTAQQVNERVSQAAAEVDGEVEAMAERVRGFQKMTALVVKRGLRVAGEEGAAGHHGGIDFIVGNRRIQPVVIGLDASGARLRVPSPLLAGTPVEVEIPAVGRLGATVQGGEGNVVELGFHIDAATRSRLAGWLASREAAAE